MEHVNKMKGIISTVVAVLTALWGWFGWLVIGLIACLVVDYATGSFAAGKNGEWKSATARDGIAHKVGCLLAVAVAGVIDCVISLILANIPAIQLPFTYTVFLCPIVVIWYIITELGSILENIVAMGTDVPEWLTRFLKIAQDAVDSTGNKLSQQDEDKKE